MENTKNLYEQLADLQNQLKEMQQRPRTLQEQIDENDPVIIEFVKNANRVWRYQGEKSDLKRETKKLKRRGIVLTIWLLIHFTYPFLLISIPYAWIIISINAIVCLIYGIYDVRKFFKKRAFELPYEDIKSRMCCEYDDNGIIKSAKAPLVSCVLKVVVFIILPIAIAVFLMLSYPNIDEFGWVAVYVLAALAVFSPILIPLNDHRVFYELYFICDEKEIKYVHLKDFMKRNNLK